jgi:hypothetical protein
MTCSQVCPRSAGEIIIIIIIISVIIVIIYNSIIKLKSNSDEVEPEEASSFVHPFAYFNCTQLGLSASNQQ